MFSLTTSPVHCCSTVFTDVTSVTPISRPRNIASKVDIYLGRLLLVRKLAMLRQRYKEVLLSPVRNAVLQKKCTGKVIRQTKNMKLPTVLLFVEFNTAMALTILTNVILSVKVLVKAVGVELLKVISTEVTVF